MPVQICPPGQELTGTSCNICPKNSFKKGTNSDQCKPCPDDENGRPYTNTAGSSKCLYVSFTMYVNITFNLSICALDVFVTILLLLQMLFSVENFNLNFCKLKIFIVGFSKTQL